MVDGYFKIYDKDGSGYLDKDEFSNWLKKQYKIDENQMRTTFDYYDKDGSGTIEKAELAAVLKE